MQDITAMEGKLGLTFRNKDLITQALTHRSYLNEHPGFTLGHNERLEFLGDAVLELVVTEYLYTHYPNPEGELTNWRAALVNAKMLAGIAATLGIEDHLLLSHGEAKDKDSKARQAILANAMEAVIGAVYLDQGYDASAEFIGRTVLSQLPHVLDEKLYLDPKSAFQEAAQERVGITPSYRVLEEKGPDHAKEFVVGAYLGTDLVATGSGTSKQEAQVQAAKEALSVKKW